MCSALNTKTLILWQDAEQTFSVSRSPFGFLVILTHSPLQKYTKTARTVTDVWARGFKFDIRQKSVSQFYPYSSLRHYRLLLGTPSYMRSPFTCRRVETVHATNPLFCCKAHTTRLNVDNTLGEMHFNFKVMCFAKLLCQINAYNPDLSPGNLLRVKL